VGAIALLSPISDRAISLTSRTKQNASPPSEARELARVLLREYPARATYSGPSASSGCRVGKGPLTSHMNTAATHRDRIINLKPWQTQLHDCVGVYH